MWAEGLLALGYHSPGRLQYASEVPQIIVPRLNEFTHIYTCRFLGFVKHTIPEIASQDLQFDLFSRTDCRTLVDDFVNWLVSEERGNSYGTVANYLNSLLSCLAFASSEVCDVDETLSEALYNLRSQSESAARCRGGRGIRYNVTFCFVFREARLYRKRHAMWITW